MEELVAEIGAAFLCADLGITPETRDDHAAYIASWLKVLKDDKRAIFTTASHAQKAASAQLAGAGMTATGRASPARPFPFRPITHRQEAETAPREARSSYLPICIFCSLTEALDTTTAQGRLVFHMFGALAEFERSLIRERTQAGLAAARRLGRTGGRPPKLTDAAKAMPAAANFE